MVYMNSPHLEWKGNADEKMTACFLVLMILLTLFIAGCSAERSSGKSGETELTFGHLTDFMSSFM